MGIIHKSLFKFNQLWHLFLMLSKKLEYIHFFFRLFPFFIRSSFFLFMIPFFLSLSLILNQYLPNKWRNEKMLIWIIERIRKNWIYLSLWLIEWVNEYLLYLRLCVCVCSFRFVCEHSCKQMFAFVFNHVVAIAKKQQTFSSSHSIHSFDNVNKQNSFGKTKPTQIKTKGFFLIIIIY